MGKLKQPLITIVVILLIAFLTKHPLTYQYRLHFTLLALLGLIIYAFKLKTTGRRAREDKTMIVIASMFVLFLVAATGWFVSPFFFLLYLLSLFLGFVFAPRISVAFIITLVVLFSFNIGEIDLAYDFLIVLSLLTVIPLTFYLKKEYLRLKEAEKEILVMKKEEKVYENKVEELLANKVNEFAVNLRQPINDTKQLAFVLKKTHGQLEIAHDADRIITSSEEALRLLQTFEEEVTGKKLLKSTG